MRLKMLKLMKKINEYQAIIKDDAYNYYLVSESRLYAKETLVFPCDDNGYVSQWSEVDGEAGSSIDEFLPKLLERGYIRRS